MGTFANIAPSVKGESLPYCVNAAVPSVEGDLFNEQPRPQPPALTYMRAVLAVVTLTAQGNISTNTTYIVMQVDLGDGVWLDVAWITWTGASGSATFVLSATEAAANAFQQRAAGTAPSPANGSNAMSLGARLRFVGKTTLGAGSSSSSSSSAGAGTVAPAVLATINFKALGLR